MRSLSRPLSRRSAQGLLAGTLIVPLTGCDLLPRAERAAPPAPTADERLADRVAAAIRRARAVAAAAAGGEPLVALHDAHLTALGAAGAGTSGAASATPTTGSPATLAHVRSAELGLETTLTDAAARADDGGLARLLASMSAAVAQQLAVLPSRRPAS